MTLRGPLLSSPLQITAGLPQVIRAASPLCHTSAAVPPCQANIATSLATAMIDGMAVGGRFVPIEVVQTVAWRHQRSVPGWYRGWKFKAAMPQPGNFHVSISGNMQQSSTVSRSTTIHTTLPGMLATSDVPSILVEAFQGDFANDR